MGRQSITETKSVDFFPLSEVTFVTYMSKVFVLYLVARLSPTLYAGGEDILTLEMSTSGGAGEEAGGWGLGLGAPGFCKKVNGSFR